MKLASLFAGVAIALPTFTAIATTRFSPPSSPIRGGNMSSKSPKIGGFRGDSRIYARGLINKVERKIGTQTEYFLFSKPQSNSFSFI